MHGRSSLALLGNDKLELRDATQLKEALFDKHTNSPVLTGGTGHTGL